MARWCPCSLKVHRLNVSGITKMPPMTAARSRPSRSSGRPSVKRVAPVRTSRPTQAARTPTAAVSSPVKQTAAGQDHHHGETGKCEKQEFGRPEPGHEQARDRDAGDECERSQYAADRGGRKTGAKRLAGAPHFGQWIAVQNRRGVSGRRRQRKCDRRNRRRSMHDGMHREEKDRAADRLPEGRERNAQDDADPAADAGNQTRQ